ncbi:neurotrophin 1 isoform X1 [Frieseomelitta varia]|uniref:neurotrophin 1 isoform X1 n=1 Tax=Frieseomelitta varia TaxID=561572 RepID=UPI001CB6A209|nr:neurotrophin 1 isoform X1 [Frieseomelitta varia]
MMARGLFFIAVVVVLLSSIDVNAEKDSKDDVDLNERKESNETTVVTSIKINDDSFRNRTNKIWENQLGKIRALLNNGSRQNVSRELMLPKSVDIAKVISDDATGDEEGLEELPEPQELKIIRPSLRKRPGYRPPQRRPSSLNRRNVYADLSRTPLIRPPRRPTEVKRDPTEKECTFFTKTVCLEAADYPHDAIARSLRSNKEMVTALLTDYKSQDFDDSGESPPPIALPLENKYENRYESNEIRRRSDMSSSFENVEEGFTCPSVIKYARPQLARAASGIWKYIINTGEHTQTLRLEKCTNPQASCSFISENYRSSCMQVYNYHRLLAWDNKLGLHMDIFKVPSCCSCHVHGYAEIFPPHQKDPPSRVKESFPGSDFATTDQKDDYEDSPKLNYLNKYTFDSSLGSSNKKPIIESTPSRPPFVLPVRTRSKKPSSTSSRPFDKLPQQHAPNTRAPGYTGPLLKGSRPSRPNRPPYRRESISHIEEQTAAANSTILNRYSQPYDLEMDATSRLQNGGFDDEYQEPQRRVNYNYHPIIDFFRPEAMMLQSSEASSTSDQNNSNSWKPLIAS